MGLLKAEHTRCVAQSAGSWAINRIKRLTFSCGGRLALTIATVMSGANVGAEEYRDVCV